MKLYQNSRYLKLAALSILVCLFSIPDRLWAQSTDRCAVSEGLQSIFLTNWESGLGSWSVGTYSVAQPDVFATPDWAVVGGLPDGRSGNAAFVADLDILDCDTEDQSGVLTLTSPSIQIPSSVQYPKVSIDHWFKIEYGWDGGNLKISVNEGPYTLIPVSAFEAIPYNDLLFPAVDEFGILYSFNPLADQEAFTGPEGDEISGQWVQSRINLQGIAEPGNSIRLRFDFGIDICLGAIGWYVDEVEVYTCTDDPPPSGTGLTLVKKVINNNGGTALPSFWTLMADGPTGISGDGPFVVSGEGFQPGTYDLSESGPSGYRASDWVCEGGTQVDGDTVTLALGESATCTITNDDIPEAELINAGHAGAWFNPETAGQGQLIDIDEAEQFMFMSWFTYTDESSDNPFEQRWFTAQGTYDGDIATLELSETLGGAFDSPQAVTTEKVGRATLRFTSCTEGEMAYKIDNEGLEGIFPMVRAIPGSESTCQSLEQSSTQAIDINAGMDGAWFDPETSGQGFLIDSDPNGENGNFMFVAWFTYGDDTASGQRWFTAQGMFEGPGAVLEINETTDGSFDDPRTPTTVPVGTMTIDFEDCSNAELTYSITDENLAGDVSIQRAVPGAEALCEEISGSD